MPNAAAVVRGIDSRTSGGTAVTGLTITHTVPTGTATGDWLIVAMQTREPTTTLTGWRVPTGWTAQTALAPSGNGAYAIYTAKYGVDVTGTSWTWDNGAGNATVTRWVSCMVSLIGTAVSAVHQHAAQAIPSATTTPASPSITTTVQTVQVGYTGSRLTGGATYTPPANWAEQSDVEESTATNAISLEVSVTDVDPVATGSYTYTPTASVSVTSGFTSITAFTYTASSSFTGTVVLSGSGTVVPTVGTFGVSGTDALSGSGTLTTTGIVKAVGTVALSASGTLTAAGRGTVALSGTGTVTFTGKPILTGTVALSGAGTLVPTGVQITAGRVALGSIGTLTTKITRTNLAMTPEPGPSGSPNWGFFAATGSFSTSTSATGGPTGGSFLRSTTTTAGNAGGNGGPYHFNIPVIPGVPYTFSCWVRSSVAVTVGPAVEWHQTGGAFSLINPSTGSSGVVLVPNTWTSISVTGTPPADAVTATPTLYNTFTQTLGATFDVTMMLAELGPTVGTFFDGATPTTSPGVSNTWSGTTENSASVQAIAGYPALSGRAALSGTGKLILRRSVPIYQWNGSAWAPLAIVRWSGSAWVATTVTLY